MDLKELLETILVYVCVAVVVGVSLVHLGLEDRNSRPLASNSGTAISTGMV